ncbi:MAG: TetR/AcrR family transcriptional regulator [Alphaproteobacteria bacterium]|nr:TetR/AcrR family transcriptional regulator [Alphaproteobacteria bacterium]
MIKKEKTSPRRGGRPSREQAEKLQDKILDAATALFFAHGYGGTSIEAVAARARITKRTLYVRFANKQELFRGVVRRIVEHVTPPAANVEQLFSGASIDETLRRVAQAILQASLSAESLALHRIIIAEATRFPELAMVLHQQKSRQEAITRIAGLLTRNFALSDPAFAAEQFLFLVVAAPQRRALGLGTPFTPAELAAWSDKAVDLFLNGCRRL